MFVIVNSDSEQVTPVVVSNSPTDITELKTDDTDKVIKKSEPDIVFVYKNKSDSESKDEEKPSPSVVDLSQASSTTPKIAKVEDDNLKDNDFLKNVEVIEEIEAEEIAQNIVDKEIVELKERIIIAIKENTSFITHIKNPNNSARNTIFSVEDNVDQLFSIDSTQGLLSFAYNTDHERPQGFSGTNIYFIKVSMETDAQKIIQPVSIFVENVNDNVPKFSNADIFDIEENTQFIANVNATDADGDSITYSLPDNANNMFSIDSLSGKLTFVDALKYEDFVNKNSSNSVMLEVSADDGEKETLQLITINLVNANDEAPVITSNNTIRVFENYGVLHQVTASDTFTDKLNYFIKNDPYNLFSINDKSGELTFTGSTDYENINNIKNYHQYNVEIGVSNGKHSASQILTLELINTNDNSPFITSESDISVLDIGGNIAQLTAIDLDNDEVSYKIVEGNDQEIFSLNQYSGALKFTQTQKLNNIDKNTKDKHHILKVSVSDGFHQTEKLLNITVKQPDLVSNVNILDRGLARCIQSQNKKYVHEVVELTCVNKGIKILMGLDKFTHLHTLNLAENNIKYIKPIASLKSLKNLNINDNFVSNIDPLKGLSKLTSIELAINAISDITPLSQLENLKFLDISENRQLEMIDTIANFKNLIYLDISQNKRIDNFGSLVHLESLEFIGIAYSNINDLLMLQPLKKLATINLQSTQAEKLEPFKTLTHLKWISVVNSEFEDESSVERNAELVLNSGQS